MGPIALNVRCIPSNAFRDAKVVRPVYSPHPRGKRTWAAREGQVGDCKTESSLAGNLLEEVRREMGS